MTPRGVAGIRTPRTAWVPAAGLRRHPAFRLGRTSVTNGEYAPYLAEGGVTSRPWWKDPAFAAPEQPVVGVTWHEAADFAEWLGRVVGGSLEAAHGRRMGVGGAGWPRRRRDAVGREPPRGRDPGRAAPRALACRPRNAQRIWSHGHGHDRPRMVRRRPSRIPALRKGSDA